MSDLSDEELNHKQKKKNKKISDDDEDEEKVVPKRRKQVSTSKQTKVANLPPPAPSSSRDPFGFRVTNVSQFCLAMNAVVSNPDCKGMIATFDESGIEFYSHSDSYACIAKANFPSAMFENFRVNQQTEFRFPKKRVLHISKKLKGANYLDFAPTADGIGVNITGQLPLKNGTFTLFESKMNGAVFDVNIADVNKYNWHYQVHYDSETFATVLGLLSNENDYIEVSLTPKRVSIRSIDEITGEPTDGFPMDMTKNSTPIDFESVSLFKKAPLKAMCAAHALDKMVKICFTPDQAKAEEGRVYPVLFKYDIDQSNVQDKGDLHFYVLPLTTQEVN